MGILHANPFCKALLKLPRETPRRQPEIKHRIRQCLHLLLIKHTGRVTNPVPRHKPFFFFLKIMVIIRHERLNLRAGFHFILPIRHSFPSIHKFIPSYRQKDWLPTSYPGIRPSRGPPSPKNSCICLSMQARTSPPDR